MSVSNSAQRSNNSNSNDGYASVSIGTENSLQPQAEQLDRKRRRSHQSSDDKKKQRTNVHTMQLRPRTTQSVQNAYRR